jgi:hypothetical protein
VTVYVRDGTYYRSEPLTFSTADSGTGGHDVVWRNYPRERPTIVGGRPLTEWEAVEGREGVYRTDVKYLGVKWFETRSVSSSRKSSISVRPRGTLPVCL